MKKEEIPVKLELFRFIRIYRNGCVETVSNLLQSSASIHTPESFSTILLIPQCKAHQSMEELTVFLVQHEWITRSSFYLDKNCLIKLKVYLHVLAELLLLRLLLLSLMLTNPEKRWKNPS